MTADRRRIPMKPINEMKVTFPSRSANEGFARAVVASFLSQLDPAVDELSDLRTAVSRGGDQLYRARLSRFDRGHHGTDEAV